MFFINHTEIIEGSAAIIQIEGPLNSETSTDFDDYINKLIDNGLIYIIIDASNLSFLSSEGLGVILLIQRNISEKNGTLIMLNLSGEISSLFNILGFSEIFKIADDRAEALKILDRIIELKTDLVYHKKAKTGSELQDLPCENKFDISHDLKPDTGPERVSPNILDEAETVNIPEKTEKKFEPFVIKCLHCSSPIRIREKGLHLCPECSSEFNVTDHQKAVFS